LNPHVTNIAVQQFVNEHLDADITRILLRKSPFPDVSSKELVEQIDSKKRSEKKLPLWFNTANIYYPPKLSIEQSSSELTADYKKNLAVGGKLIDLTGGFGVDSYYFSQTVKEVTCCELNAELSQIATYNASLLKANNIRFVNADSIGYLQQTDEVFHTIFADPSRRIKNSKVFMLKDCEPDVVANTDLLLSKAGRIIIKTSPLLDISSGLKELKHVSSIHVISVKNDCKELLWIIDRDYTEEPQIHCAAINDAGTQTFSFRLSEERSLLISSYSDPKKYLYEPDVALLKAGCFKLITKQFNVEKLHSNTHLYTSEECIIDFPGRVFEVVACLDYKSFIKAGFPDKANIITRNFPSTPEEIKKKHRIADGGSNYLLFTTGLSNQLLVIQAKRL
jgi:16S rRNA G966 N2-methylase RsmD